MDQKSFLYPKFKKQINLSYLQKQVLIWYSLPVSHESHGKKEQKGEFLIQNKFLKDSKIILTGTVVKGAIKRHQLLYIGPDETGVFRTIKVLNIHCYKVDVRMASCGQTCS